MNTVGETDIVPTREAPLSREAYTLLAQANLLRMRGRWEEAVEKCMAALRLAPDNASAQSLLGDIYENQGRFDDAIQWYRMALDVNPDSPADKLKLGRLLSPEPRFSADLPRLDAPASRMAPPVAAANRPPADAERLLRGVAWLAAALFLVAAILSGLVMAKHRPPTGPITTTPVVVSAPSAPAPSESGSSPALTGQAPTPATSPLPGDAQASESQTSDSDEQSLLQTLTQDAALAAQNVVPLNVQIDPRQSAATVTVLCTLPQGAAAPRDALLQDAAAAALAGDRAQGDRIASWTIRCLTSPIGGSAGAAPDLMLVADTTSAALSGLGSNAASVPAAQIQSAFHNIWWAPSVTQ